MKIFDLINKVNNFLLQIFNRLFFKIDFLFIKIDNFVLKLDIKKQKEILINKNRGEDILTSDKQKIKETENLIKEILDKHHLTEKTLKKIINI